MAIAGTAGDAMPLDETASSLRLRLGHPQNSRAVLGQIGRILEITDQHLHPRYGRVRRT
ncbi:hypothetical protein [Mycolicibacterium poriferae]|jgi:hypothetical protein|uniref:hypothetical protein n=1 Tax=Mycolicibacterium poriferae TaxID=39694 RepID=UPI0024BB2AA5|nr:hypothetical protein [Mycolicibacterium poriferae]